MNNPYATIIGTLPPLKGLSSYCLELINSLSKYLQIEFIGFKKLYPDFLYPGGTRTNNSNYTFAEKSNVFIRNILTYYNPFSWIWAGLTIHGKIVHAQWWSPVLAPIYYAILILSKIRRKKIIITIHNIFPHEKNYVNILLNRLIFTLGDRLIVHNKNNKKAILDRYNIPENSISIIPHGILTPVAIKGIPAKEAREYLKIPINKRVILNFGNIRDYKGLDILLHSFAIVKKDMEDVILIIAGACWGSFKKYDEIILENKIEKSIIKKIYFIPPS